MGWLGIDRAALLAIGTSVVAATLGPVTAIVVGTHLSPELQGFYYTFGSLSLLQLLAEFGLGHALAQLASHAWPGLRLEAGGRLDGEPEALTTIASLADAAITWCSRAGLLLAAAMVIAGAGMFGGAARVSWLGPWLLFAACLVGNFVLAPVWALLQGCQQVEPYWTYRLVQQVVNALSIWVALWLGAGLWTPGIAGLVGLLWSATFLLWRFPRFVPFLKGSRSLARRGDTWSHLWSLQWRNAVSWITAYFTSQLFVPILFKLASPAEAGRMGMTSTLGSVVLAISSNLVVTKGPHFGTLVARREFSELDRLFRQALAGVIACALAGAVGAIALVVWLNARGYALAERLLPPSSAALYLASVAGASVVVSLATYLRAFRRDPLAPVLGASSLLTLGAALAVAPRHGALGVCAAAMVVSLVVQLPLSALVFRRSREAGLAEGLRDLHSLQGAGGRA
jgi:hypothetical protein